MAGEEDWLEQRNHLLGHRISDLGLAVQGSRVEQLVAQLYAELQSRGLRFRPPVYLSDQWGCPDGTPLIGVPFYLADPRLERIEAEMALAIEDDAEAMRYLRHEAGHAFNYAFRLHERADWQHTFGSFGRPYRERYRANPFSRAHVRHILGWYAQKHPDEDFAETFAVWLTPGLAKKVLRFHSIRTPEFATVYRGTVDWAGDINFPVIVKPPQEDASIGITNGSIVHDLKELFGRIDSLQSEFKAPVLVEEFVDGREFYVGVLGNFDAQALPVIEMDFSGLPAGAPHIASWEAKWGADGSGAGEGAERSAEFAGTKSVFPTDLEESLVERMQQIAVNAFEALRLRDYARIDLRVSPAEEIYVIEVNPNCYLERNAEFARAAERDGISYHGLVERIVDLASARYAR